MFACDRFSCMHIFFYFQDLPNAMNAAEITDKLGLHSLRNRNWYIQVCKQLDCFWHIIIGFVNNVCSKNKYFELFDSSLGKLQSIYWYKNLHKLKKITAHHTHNIISQLIVLLLVIKSFSELVYFKLVWFNRYFEYIFWHFEM